MIAAEVTVLVLLAAGRSARFPGGNKLEQDLLGRPVGLHVVAALEEIRFLDRVVVVDGGTLTFPEYTVIHNDVIDRGMSHSVRLGVERAEAIGAEAVVVALADMPRVTAAQIRRLLDAADGPAAVVTSSDGSAPCPPALFGRDRFDALLRLEGDAGARDLIKAGRHVVTSAAELVDIDTLDDLEQLRRLLGAPDA